MTHDRGPSRLFCFGDFAIDEGLLQLRRADRVVELRPKPLRLLLYLIENRDRVVSKDEIFRWWDAAVSDAAISTALKQIRQALEDDSGDPRWIQTRRRVGYQFVGSVAVQTAELDAQAAGAPATGAGVYGIPRGLSMSFVGRAHSLLALEALLLRDTYISLHASVEGLAGIGKTEIVLQLVHKLAHEQRFPGGIFWLDAEQPDLRPIWGTVIANRFGIEGGSVDERCQKLLQRLDRTRDAMLVVLDNVTTWSSRSGPEPLPQGPHVRVLVTTRQRNLAGPQFSHLAVDVLRPPHDGELVLQLAGRDVEPGFDDLLKHLAGHALGLALAGAFLGTYRADSARTYLAALRSNAEVVEGAVSERVRYEGTVTEAFRTVWQRMSDAARRAWQIAAQFEPVPATRSLAAATGLDEASLHALEERHLIQCSGDGRWIMHRLTREFALRAGAADERLAARQQFAEGCAARSLLIRPSGPSVYLEDRPHFDAALRIAREALAPEAELKLVLSVGPALMVQRGYASEEVARVYERAIQLADETGRHEDLFLVLPLLWLHFMTRGDWRSCAALARQCQELARRQAVERHAVLAAILIGITDGYTGRLREASDRLEGANAFVRAAEPALLRGLPVASLLAHTGFVRCLTGFPEEALTLCIQAVDHAADAQDPAGRAMAHGWWRAALHQFRGEWDEVEHHARTAVEIGLAHELPLYQHMPAILVGWARVARDPTNAHASLPAMEQAQARLVQLDLGVAQAYARGLIGDAYLRAGRHAEARAHVQQALELAETTGERFFEPELWRIRALASEAPRQRREDLERALDIATQLGARWWALRAAVDLVEGFPEASARAQFEPTLRALHDSLSEGRELGYRRRAERLLARA